MAEDFDDLILSDNEQDASDEDEPEHIPSADIPDPCPVLENQEKCADKDKEILELQGNVADVMAELRLDDDLMPLNTFRMSTSKDVDDEKESISGFSCISRSTAATIAPDVIKQRLKKSFEKSDKINAKKRIRAKGEASATTRQRRDNSDNIRQSTGIWGWE